MAAHADDPRRAEALKQDIAEVGERLGVQGLVRHSGEWVGPCPECGGRDRFSISPRKGVFNCRRCNNRGDVIGLVMWLQKLTFPEALTWLCGPPQEVTPEERAARYRAYAAQRAERERVEAQFRAKAVAEARVIWQAGLPPEDSPVRDYLTRRGIPRDLYPRLPVSLRFHPDLPCMVKASSGGWREAHRGPAMLAAIQNADGRFCAVHRTWIDLEQPKGKAVICHPETGEVLNSKTTRGAKKGGAIRLQTASGGLLVMGEGIETTLSACVADVLPGASYWAGVDLGNMSGQRMMGKGQRFAGLPDMDDRQAFVPPPWVNQLIYVMDGDSDPRSTPAQLEAGLRRAMRLRPGLRGRIWPVESGLDMNDVLMGGAA